MALALVASLPLGAYLAWDTGPLVEPELAPSVVRAANETGTTWYFLNYEVVDPLSVFTFEVHNCSGEPGYVGVWTPAGFVESFYYHGQGIVYLGYMHTTYYFDGVQTWEEWDWFGSVTKYYREGSWVPSDGIEFRYAANQTFGDAKLLNNVFPSFPDPVAIPEFGDALIPVLVVLAVVVVLRRIRA